MVVSTEEGFDSTLRVAKSLSKSVGKRIHFMNCNFNSRRSCNSSLKRESWHFRFQLHLKTTIKVRPPHLQKLTTRNAKMEHH